MSSFSRNCSALQRAAQYFGSLAVVTKRKGYLPGETLHNFPASPTSAGDETLLSWPRFSGGTHSGGWFHFGVTKQHLLEQNSLLGQRFNHSWIILWASWFTLTPEWKNPSYCQFWKNLATPLHFGRPELNWELDNCRVWSIWQLPKDLYLHCISYLY